MARLWGLYIAYQKTIIMRTAKNKKVTFDKMIALLNRGINTYMEELGPKSYKNPSFVFINKSQAA